MHQNEKCLQNVLYMLAIFQIKMLFAFPRNEDQRDAGSRRKAEELRVAG